tara:strand:+ start:210 stop:359 length:150 start_codon:yes stop_codon:yes gene_type:complete
MNVGAQEIADARMKVVARKKTRTSESTLARKKTRTKGDVAELDDWTMNT